MNTSNALPVSIGFHTTAHILMCGSCNIGCPTSRALSTHLRTVHKIPSAGLQEYVEKANSAAKGFAENSDAKDVSDLYTSAPSLSPANSQEVSLLNPLAGLPVRDGVQCSACFIHHSTIRTLPSHLEKVHGYSPENSRMEATRLSNRHMVKVQTLFGGNKTKFFPVNNSLPVGELLLTGTIPGDVAQPCGAKVEPKAIPATHGENELPERVEDSEENVVMQEAVPSAHATDVNASVKSLFQTLGKEEQEAGSSGDGPNRVEHALKNSFTSATHFDDALQLLGLSPNDALSIMEPSLELQDNTVLGRQEVVNEVLPYFSRLGDMLPNTSSRVLRSVNLRDENRQFQRTTSQTENRYALHIAQLLIFAYKSASMPFSSGINLLPVVVLFENWEHGRGVGSSSGAPSDAFKERLHHALKCLLLATIEQTESLSMLVVRNFMVCACVIRESAVYQSVERPPYRHADADDASPILAALQYSVGAIAVHDVWYIRDKFHREDQKGVRDAETVRLFASVSPQENSAAVFIRNTLNTAMGILKREESRPNFDHCAVHLRCGVVNYNHLSMERLGKIVSSQHKSFDEMFYEELLLGASLPANFNSAISSLRDQPSSRSPGFSFMNNPGRQLDWVHENTEFVFKVLQNPSPQQLHKTPCILTKDVNGPDVVYVAGIPMRRSRVEKFLRSCEKLQDCLLIAMHFSSGSPARATEIRALRLHNDVHSIRNLFISQDGEVVINPTYTKARSLCGFSRPVYRFPDKGTALRLLQYYVFIRPLECAMIESLVGREAMNKQWVFMFARKGSQLSAQHIRNIVAKALRSMGVPIGLADYRQFSSGMVPVVCKKKLQNLARDVMDDFISVGHEQASHTRNVAEKKYARTPGLLPNCSLSDLAKAKQFSFEWHSVMGLQSTIRDEVAEALFGGNEEHVGGWNVVEGKPHPSLSGRLSMTGNAQSTVICSAALPVPVPSSTPPSVFSHAILEGRVGLGSGPAAVNLHVGRLDQYDYLVKPLTAELKAAIGSPTAEFKSQTQFSVTAFVLWQRFNALVLMPTGAGKTMCVLLPVVIEKAKKKSTIIIVPLRALVTQYLSTAVGFGLVASSDFGDPGADAFAHLYIFSAEQVRKPGFQELVSRLLTKQLLSRVVIDEAHLTVLWESFRVSLQSIRTGLSVVPPHIPRILLSATVPPHQRACVLEKHGINDATVFSMPTLRKNLGFEVVVFEPQSPSAVSVEKKKLRTEGGRFVSPSKGMIVQSLELLMKRLLEEVDGKSEIFRVMIYVLTRREVGSVGGEVQRCCDDVFGSKDVVTQTLQYHGGMLDDEREQMHQEWMAPPSGGEQMSIRIMVCTSAFGTGVDVPNVRLTLHIGGARSLVEFVQECGRAGRDGFKAICLTTYDSRYEVCITHDADGTKSETEKMVSIQRRNEMTTWITSSETCRKNRLYSFIDGGVAGVCRFDANTVWCDVCRVGTDGFNSDSIFHSTPESNIPWRHETDAARHVNPETPTYRGQDPRIDAVQSVGPSRKRTSNPSPTGAAIRRRLENGSFKSLPPTRAGNGVFKVYSGTNSKSTKAGNGSFTVFPPSKSNSMSAGPLKTGTYKVHSSPVRRQLSLPSANLEPCPWIEEASGDDIKEVAYQLHILAQETCLMCLAVGRKRDKHLKTSCTWFCGRCLRCYSTTHSVRACPKDTKIMGLCFGCGMNTCKNSLLHASGFVMGTKCNLQTIVGICWALWDQRSLREAIVQNFFTTATAKKYRSLQRKPSSEGMHAIFSDAMKESPDAVPMPIRLALSWAIGKELLEV